MEEWLIEQKKIVCDIGALEPAGIQVERAQDQRHGEGIVSGALERGRLEPLAQANRDAKIRSTVVQTDLQ